LLAVTVISVVFETSQGLSRELSRLRLWLAGSGVALFCVLVVLTQRLVRPMILASFVSGILVCTFFFLGWIGVQRRR